MTFTAYVRTEETNNDYVTVQGTGIGVNAAVEAFHKEVGKITGLRRAWIETGQVATPFVVEGRRSSDFLECSRFYKEKKQ